MIYPDQDFIFRYELFTREIFDDFMTNNMKWKTLFELSS